MPLAAATTKFVLFFFKPKAVPGTLIGVLFRDVAFHHLVLFHIYFIFLPLLSRQVGFFANIPPLFAGVAFPIGKVQIKVKH